METSSGAESFTSRSRESWTARLAVPAPVFHAWRCLTRYSRSAGKRPQCYKPESGRANRVEHGDNVLWRYVGHDVVHLLKDKPAARVE